MQGLISDLQNDNAPVQLPDLKQPSKLTSGAARPSSTGYRTRVLGGARRAGMAIGWGLYGNSSSPFDFTTDPGAKPDGVVPIVVTAPDQLQSLGGLSGLFEQMQQSLRRHHGLLAVDLGPTAAYLDRPTPATTAGC